MKFIDKIIEINKIEETLEPIRDKKIVFTNGCFDILHRGHVEYLSKSAELGDILVIGLNSDDSIRRIKGLNRPIQNQENRSIILAAFEFVNYVVIFNEDTPYELIKKVIPNVLVKGSDYKIENIVGRDIVESNGGEVCTIDLIDGQSTTNIINIINKLNNT